MGCEYGNDLSELVNEGWDYNDAVEWLEFICGSEDEGLV